MGVMLCSSPNGCFCGLWPCGGQSACKALMSVGCAGRRKLAYVSPALPTGIESEAMRVCPPQGVFERFLFILFSLIIETSST